MIPTGSSYSISTARWSIPRPTSSAPSTTFSHREGLPAVPVASARKMIGAGARRMIERGLELEGRTISVGDIDRLTSDFIAYYAAHIADAVAAVRGTGSRAR